MRWPFLSPSEFGLSRYKEPFQWCTHWNSTQLPPKTLARYLSTRQLMMSMP